jgi:hypothetical protein
MGKIDVVDFEWPPSAGYSTFDFLDLPDSTLLPGFL